MGFKEEIRVVAVILMVCLLSSVAFGELPANIGPAEISRAKEFLKTPEGQKLLESKEAKEAIQGVKADAAKKEPEKPKEGETAAEAPPELSEIEAQFNRPESRRFVTQFGYSLFRESVSTFAPVENVPVGEDYIIGPGDAFTVTLWGISEGIFKVTVNRDGTIVLPKAGVITVAGMTFGELRQYLQQILGKYFEGVNLAITMDKIRTINVYIMGEVGKPGSYSLSSLSTVYSALFAAAGPTRRGTLRNIELVRNNKLVAKIDLYDFLLKGDKSQDRKLESGDTIFVPFIGPVVAISGSVNRSAIFEIKGSPRLKDVLWLAGDVQPTSDLSRIQIERLIAHEKKVVIDKDLSRYQRDKELLNFPVQDMDFIQVFAIPAGVQNVVNLEGNVARPGRYEWKEGMRLKDLFPNGYSDLRPQPFEEYGYITRLVPPDMHQENLSFNLKKLLEGDAGQNIALNKMDVVRVFGLGEQEDKPAVEITGFVRRAGRYDYVEGMTLKDLVYQAGNKSVTSYSEEVEVFRTVPKGDKAEHARLVVDLKKALDGDPKHNLKLQNFDRVNVRSIQNWYQGKVILSGQVKFPGEYPISRGERLSSVLERAGGFTDDAYLFGAVFTRQSIKNVQNQKLVELINRIEGGLLSRSQAPQLGEAADKTALELERTRQLLERLRASVAEGRVIIKLTDLKHFKGSEYDLELEDGDTLAIPMQVETVAVIGEVYNPAGVLYQEGKNVYYYLEKVGGAMAEGDLNNMYVLRADGSVLSRSSGTLNVYWDRLFAGDTVVIPPRFEKPADYWAGFKDVVNEVFQLVMIFSVIRTATK